MKNLFYIFNIFNIFAIYGEAISLEDVDSYNINFSEINLKPKAPIDASEKVQVKVFKPIVDFATVQSNYTPIENVRFENAADLPKIVNMILHTKSLYSDKVIWAVFDVDETLIDRDKDGRPMDRNTNAIFKKLNDAGVPIVLLTMSSDPRPKFKRAGLKFEGVITEALLSRDGSGGFVPKGKTLQRYIASLPKKQRPDHVFFADDQLFSDQWVESYLGKIPVYIQSVEESMKESGIPFTTFHFQRKTRAN